VMPVSTSPRLPRIHRRGARPADERCKEDHRNDGRSQPHWPDDQIIDF
jgi:hypothetical protein